MLLFRILPCFIDEEFKRKTAQKKDARQWSNGMMELPQQTFIKKFDQKHSSGA